MESVTKYFAELCNEERLAIAQAKHACEEINLIFDHDITVDETAMRMWASTWTWTESWNLKVMCHGTNWLDLSRDFIRALNEWALKEE